MIDEIVVKKCSRCREEKTLDQFGKDSRYRHGRSSRCKPCGSKDSAEYAKRNREKVTERQRRWVAANRERLTANLAEKHRILKQSAVDAYGGRCMCCGVTELIWLTIDHIAGDGAARRRAGEHAHGRKFYEWLKRNDWPKGFQTLCFNCNWAKHHGRCPHQEEASAEFSGLFKPR